MKKIVVLLLIGAFALSPMVQSDAQAAGKGAKEKALTHKIEKKKAELAKLKAKRKTVKQQHVAKAKPAAKHKVG